jgi:hypothetical protein
LQYIQKHEKEQEKKPYLPLWKVIKEIRKPLLPVLFIASPAEMARSELAPPLPVAAENLPERAPLVPTTADFGFGFVWN